MSPSYHVVFDCNIFVQALLNPEGVGGACLELVRRGNINLYVSPEILKEIREVLQRPTVISRFPSLTPDVVDAFLDDIIGYATIIRDVPKKFHYERDPEDEPYINLAVKAGADYIVSRDKDLLDLMTGITIECKEFRQRFRLLKIIEPLAFLQEIK